MKYYVLFDKKNEYKGYSTERKIVNLFLKQRGKKFKIKKIPAEKMSERMLRILQDDFKELYTLDIEDGRKKIAILGYEDQDFTDMINEIPATIGRFIFELKVCLDAIKLTKKEDKIISKALDIIDERLWIITQDSHEPDLNQYYRLYEYLKDFLKIK